MKNLAYPVDEHIGLFFQILAHDIDQQPIIGATAEEFASAKSLTDVPVWLISSDPESAA
jgi:hypothetical protein